MTPYDLHVTLQLDRALARAHRAADFVQRDHPGIDVEIWPALWHDDDDDLPEIHVLVTDELDDGGPCHGELIPTLTVVSMRRRIEALARDALGLPATPTADGDAKNGHRGGDRP